MQASALASVAGRYRRPFGCPPAAFPLWDGLRPFKAAGGCGPVCALLHGRGGGLCSRSVVLRASAGGLV